MIKVGHMSPHALTWFGVDSVSELLDLKPYIKVREVFGAHSVEMLDFMLIRKLRAGSNIVSFSKGDDAIRYQLDKVTLKDRVRIYYVFDTPASDKVCADITLWFKE